MKTALKKKPDRIARRQTKEKAALLEHLRKMPIVQVACARAGLSRATYYRWRKNDDDFDEKADDALYEGVQMINDMAQSVIIKRIQENDLRAATYWLSQNYPPYDPKRKPLERPEEMRIIQLDA